MYYKNTFARLLMTTAIVFTSLSIQETWASQKLPENGEDENNLKRKRPDSMNENLMDQDSDLAFAMHLQMDEDPFFNVSPIKKTRYIKNEKDDSTYEDELETPESDDEMDVIENKRPNNPINVIINNNINVLNQDPWRDNQQNHNNNNNNQPNEAKKKTVLKINLAKHNKKINHNGDDNVIKEEKEEKEERNALQMVQPAVQNFPPMGHFNQAQPMIVPFNFNQQQPFNAVQPQANQNYQPAVFGNPNQLQWQDPVHYAAQQLQQPLPAEMPEHMKSLKNPQVFIEALQDASLRVHGGVLIIYIKNKHDHDSMELKFHNFLPQEDWDLINEVTAKIRKNGKRYRSQYAKINNFQANISKVLFYQDKTELPENLRQAIRSTISDFDQRGRLTQLINYIEKTFLVDMQPKTLNSPILKCLSGKKLPGFIQQIQKQRQQQAPMMQQQAPMMMQQRVPMMQQQAPMMQQHPIQKIQLQQALQNILQPMAQNAQPKLVHAQKGWSYDRNNARNATPEEAQLYEDMRAKLFELSNKVGPSASDCAAFNIEDVETLHKNNIEICDELFSDKMLFSRKYNGVVLHGEQSDSNLELRAQNIYLTFLAAWNALKAANNEELYVDFFKNAFISADRHACLEGRAGGIDIWHQKNKSKLNNISLSFEDQIKERTIDDNIVECSKIIYSQFLEQSNEGKKLNQLRKNADKNQALRDQLKSALEKEPDPAKKALIEERIAEV